MSDKEHKFGVEHFAKKAGVEPATARVMLRKAKVKKSGRSYGWDSQGAMEKDLKKCRPEGGKSSAPKKKSKKTAPKRKSKEEGASASA